MQVHKTKHKQVYIHKLSRTHAQIYWVDFLSTVLYLFQRWNHDLIMTVMPMDKTDTWGPLKNCFWINIWDSIFTPECTKWKHFRINSGVYVTCKQVSHPSLTENLYMSLVNPPPMLLVFVTFSHCGLTGKVMLNKLLSMKNKSLE